MAQRDSSTAGRNRHMNWDAATAYLDGLSFPRFTEFVP
jgi:hypothetical protein